MSNICIERTSSCSSSFEEKLNITYSDIYYSIKWDELRLEQGLSDLSWRRMPPNTLLANAIRNITDILLCYKPDLSKRDVCDGDITTIIVEIDGKVLKFVFALCAYDEIRQAIGEEIKQLLPPELPLPEFLHSYSDDIEEVEEQ